MKRLLFLICTLFSFVIVAELSSCFVNDDDDGRLNAPEITDKSEAGASVSVPVPFVHGAKYINIFRESANDEDMTDPEVCNIGQIFPDKTKSSTTFLDSNLNSVKWYRYYFRYTMGSYVQYTKESDPVKRDNGTGELIIGTKKLPLNYICVPEDRTFDLKVTETVVLPDDGYDLLFVVSNGTETRPFKFASGDSDHAVKTGTTIDIQKNLTSEFLGVPVSIESMIASRKEASDTVIYYWSNPREVELTKIEDGNSDVVDEITVPKTGSNTNNLDYHANVASSTVVMP